MKESSRRILSVLCVVLIAYFLLGLVGVLPAQFDVTRGFSTGVETFDIIFYNVPTGNALPHGIVTDLSGDVWFTERWGAIGKLSDGTITEYPIGYSGLYGIDIDDYGNIWTESWSLKVLIKFDNQQTITPYQIPFQCSPTALCVDKFNQIWFTGQNEGKIGKMTQEGQFTPYDLPSPYAQPTCIKTDTEGNIWIASNSCIYKMTQAGEFTSFNFGSWDLNTDDQNNIWSINFGTESISERKNTGEIFYYPVNQGSGLISVCPANGTWVTCSNYNTLGYLNTSNLPPTYTQLPNGAGGNVPYYMATDGTYLYWTVLIGNKIGRLRLPSIQEQPPITPPIPTEMNNITITVTQAGDNGTAIVDTSIPIEAQVECNDTIDTVRVLYKGVGSDNWQSVDMTLTSGDANLGLWSGNIPAQGSVGTVTCQVFAKSSTGNEAITSFFDIYVEELQPTPTPAPAITIDPTLFYGSFLILFTAVGVVVNYKP